MLRPFLNHLTSFKKAYPSISTILVKTHQSGDVDISSLENALYHENNLPMVIPCANEQCKEGGIAISSQIDTMVYSRQTHLKNTFYCRGHIGKPKSGDPCANIFEIEIDIKYLNPNSYD